VAAFLKGSNSSASSGIPENQQYESVISGNIHDESAVSQDEENESSLLQFDQSINNEEHDVTEQLNPDVEILQFSEQSIEDVNSAPISTKKDDEALALIGDVSIDHSALQDMAMWPI
jgi:hypothetical protein